MPVSVCLPNLDLMERTGISHHRTTYLISLTLVKVETSEEHGVEKARQSVEGETSQTGGQQTPPKTDLSNVAQDPQKKEEVTNPEAWTDVQLRAEQEILLSPRDHKALFADGAHPSDRRKSITSSATENGGVKEATGAAQPSTAKEVAELMQLPTTSNVLGQVSKRPISLLKAHSGALSNRELRKARDSMHASSKSLDRKDSRSGIQSPASPAPGSFRASWAVCEAKQNQEDPNEGPAARGSMEGAIAMRTQSPRAERLKAGSTSLPGPVTLVSKPQRKGKSRTLDNSDLNCLSEDLLKGKGGQVTSDIRAGQSQGASTRDRKMLRFISGIFTKSTQVATSTGVPPQTAASTQRESSEDEGRKAVPIHNFNCRHLIRSCNHKDSTMQTGPLQCGRSLWIFFDHWYRDKWILQGGP